MSKVSLAGNASGTGIFTIASPNSNTDRTLTLPDNSGTVLTSASSVTQNSGPAFSAYKNAGQSFSSAVQTKVTFQTEEFDTNSCYDTATSRFTPTVAGYYQINTELDVYSNSGLVFATIYKNGSENKRGNGTNASNSETYTSASALIYCNGTTDYIEIYVWSTSGSPAIANSGIVISYFQAAMIRSA
jgi:hypothetical protein